jgi:hypothetical protein
VCDIFSKMLVAHYSPKNGCNAPDGAVLVVRPRRDLPARGAATINHQFVEAAPSGKKSRFGWVASVESFNLAEFVARHLGGKVLDEQEREHLLVLLRSIAQLAPGTPVGTHYLRQGLLPSETEVVLRVHKVLFYKK